MHQRRRGGEVEVEDAVGAEEGRHEAVGRYDRRTGSTAYP
jgi:hypothetical protein